MATSTDQEGTSTGRKGESVILQSGIPRKSNDDIVFKGKEMKKGNPEAHKKEAKDRKEVPGNRKRRDDSVIKNPVLVERANLLNVAKLCIKTLIESAMEEARILDDEYVPLQQFFVVMEHVMNHGVKGKKTFLEKKRSFWNAVESLEKSLPDFSEIIDSVRNLPGIKTSLGRGRAWLRLAMMQKKLADYFKALIESKHLLSEWYEPTALVMEEEAMVIAGLLVGLNAIDCNFCLKGDDLDSAPSVIDFSMYFKDGNYLDKPMEASSGSPTVPTEVNLATLLDQKNYLEEHNRHLTSQISGLHARIKALEDSNASMKGELAMANNNILSIQADNDLLRAENNTLKHHTEKKLEMVKADIETERETYNTSRQGLNEMYTEAKQRLQQETQMRLDVEQELQLQISLKMEMEMAMRLLEKDIHEKQDTIISLRKQLEDIKSINIDLYKKIQGTEETMKHKSELVGRLEEKTNQMVETIKQLEERLRNTERDKQACAETARKLGMQIAERDIKCSNLAADLKVEGEWRATLQKEIAQEKELISQLQAEVADVVSLREQLASLLAKHEELGKTCHEQELALAEMGSKLSESQLKMDSMKEVVQSAEGRVWADDKDVKNCMTCDKPFSVSRRKHHCRNCGGIYCGLCSDNLMPLPSSAKPVRVCDNCNTELLQRYSATSR
ncbi:RUN and FYVE domain-containing protein 2-like isoform X1 [Lytechinus variegatus]|uniref:RUN and FYVE domain-containing protein 2-like isoform X1 n=1 Tax=Lytechinus variegatus TaxID=7654 RepID=UPI001BB10339|nr:RUN and FYVE domain-containing protein 2-like isoform X1 [Lytechinus variegatus]